MPKSAAYARIKADILRIVEAIPEGRITTYAEIGRHLDVMPRHVAYILTMLGDEEKARYSWHRVIAEKGRLGRAKSNGFGVSQVELLASEGIKVGPGGAVVDYKRLLVSPADAPSRI